MRHQPRFVGDGVEQVGVGLDAIDRGQPQPRELGHLAQNRLSRSRPRPGAPEIAAIGGEIDAGQHDLAESPVASSAADGDHACRPASSATRRGQRE